ncbi:hypothetical protein [Nocardia grenadensis]|uniref:hypothetical protein n=1 Tax=Nocardia grenadensis TaxID=931537 RepID=UPI001C3FC88F|nr:hypothetical protein [Nocardia grenadensis]
MTHVRQDMGGRRRTAGEGGAKPSRKRAAKKAAPTAAREATAFGRSRLAQVRLRDDEMRALEQVMQTLDLASTSDALREGLKLLAKEAAEVGAAEEIRAFYKEQSAPLPAGVVEPSDSELAAADDMRW